jgi:hypothetical protein
VCSLDIDAESVVAMLRLSPRLLSPALTATIDAARAIIVETSAATLIDGNNDSDNDDGEGNMHKGSCGSGKSSVWAERVAQYCVVLTAGVLSRGGTGAISSDVVGVACAGLEAFASLVTDLGLRIDVISTCVQGLQQAASSHPPAPPLQPRVGKRGDSDWRVEGASTRAPIETVVSRVPLDALPLWSAPREMQDLAELTRLLLPQPQCGDDDGTNPAYSDALLQPTATTAEDEQLATQVLTTELVSRLSTGAWASTCGWDATSATFLPEPHCAIGTELAVMSAWLAAGSPHRAVAAPRTVLVIAAAATALGAREKHVSSALGSQPGVPPSPQRTARRRVNDVFGLPSDTVTAELHSVTPDRVLACIAAHRSTLTSASRVCAAALALVRLRDAAMQARRGVGGNRVGGVGGDFGMAPASQYNAEQLFGDHATGSALVVQS